MTPPQHDGPPSGPAPGGPAPADDVLGRLLADGLHRHAGGPVDERHLVAGARAGAARIRARRQAAVRALSVLVIAVPLGFGGFRLLTLGGSTGTATSASSAQDAAPAEAAGAAGAAGAAEAPFPADATVAPSGDGAGSGAGSGEAGKALGSQALSGATAAGTATPVPSSSAAGPGPVIRAPLERTAGGAVAVPDQALLTGATVTQITGAAATPAGDTAGAASVPVPAPAQMCGQAVTGTPVPAGAREVQFRAGGMSVAVVVRVFGGDRAGQYVRAVVAQQTCLVTVTVPGSLDPVSLAAVGPGTLDAQGRRPWFAIAVSGRIAVETRVTVPAGTAFSAETARGLLTAAVDAAQNSGLVEAASADPGLT